MYTMYSMCPIMIMTWIIVYRGALLPGQLSLLPGAHLPQAGDIQGRA